MLISGTIYLVPTYSGDLKQALGFDQSQINAVTTATSVGAWVSIPGGLFLDRFGFRLTAIVGGLLLFTGYMLLSLAVSRALPTDSAGVVALFTFLAGQGVGFTYMTGLKANASNFPDHLRGRAIGAMVTFFGLSSGVFTLISSGFFGAHTQASLVAFLQFLAITLAVVAVGGGMLCNHVPDALMPMEPSATKRLWALYIIAFLVAVYVTVAAVLSRFAGVSNSVLVWPALVLLLPLVLLPVRVGRLVAFESDEQLLHGGNSSSSSASASAYHGAAGQGPSRQYSLWEVLKHADFWLLFFVFFFAIGPGIMAQQNLPEIVISRADYNATVLAGDPIRQDELPGNATVGSLLPLFSVFSAFGRMFAGIMLDRFGDPVRLMFIPLAFVALSMVTFAFTNLGGLFFAMPALGFGYGQVFALTPIILIDEFGAQSFGTSWGLLGTAPAFGALASNSLAGALDDKYEMDAHITVVSLGSGIHVDHCVGMECYQYSFLVCVVSLVIATAINTWLFWRRRQKLRRAATKTSGTTSYMPLEETTREPVDETEADEY
jgi:MFS family permease